MRLQLDDASEPQNVECIRASAKRRYSDYMRPVAVIGIGKTQFGAFPDRDLRSLAAEAGRKCLENGNLQPSRVEALYLGNFAGPSFVGQNHLAP